METNDGREPKADQANSDAPKPSEEPCSTAPVCSQRLNQSRCKLVCEKCGYFMSCADYY